jgi:hypothetical protein
MQPTKPSMGAAILLVFLIAFVAPIASALNQTSSPNQTAYDMLHAGEFRVQQDPVQVVSEYIAALKTNDPTAALAFFTDDAVFKILPEEAPGGIIAVGKTRIGLWLQEVMQGQGGGLLVELLSDYKVAGKNVTWSMGLWFERYYTVADIGDVLPGTAEAAIQGDKISAFTFTLTPDSVARLTKAQASSPQSRVSISISTSGFLFGLVVLGLVIPAAAMYYISRVRSLFAAIPRLERPWFLLLAGVASLFVAVLMILLRGFLSLPSWDAVYSTVLVLTAFFILASMVLMKRVWTITGSG